MRFLLLLSISCALVWSTQAQPPATYYTTAFGKQGAPLRAALYNIIKGHSAQTYTPGLWNAFYTTDVKPNGKLWDMYSDKPGATAPYEYNLGSNQCGSTSASAENFCYNREHSWPKSFFGGANSYTIYGFPMYTDLFLVIPSDAWVNSKRSNLPYGKAAAPFTFTSQNGSRIGNQSYAGAPSGQCFEPIDSFKGDLARNYFYVSTRYLGDSNQFITWEMADKINLKPWAIQMLLEWHHKDPVSKKEIDRNEAVYAIQNNRNPFIDYPLFADCIWGTGNCSTLSIDQQEQKAVFIFPNPAKQYFNLVGAASAQHVRVLDMMGSVLMEFNPSASMQIPIDQLSNGIYMVEVEFAHEKIIRKLLIEN